MAARGARTGFGVDIGGSGIKGCTVDLDEGRFAGERVRIPTPQPATPDAVVDVVRQVVQEFGWGGPFGCTFPGVVQRGVVRTAANVDKSWIGVDLAARLQEATGLEAHALNDADAAGVAEERFGAARDEHGVVLMTTLGTGIGSALIVGGTLVPNTELGHLELDGKDAETRAADSARERKGLTWEKWAQRLQRYYSHLEGLFWPDLFVVGGGVSKKADKFLPLLDLRTPIVPAGLLNDGGIIGAAMAAAERSGTDGSTSGGGASPTATRRAATERATTKRTTTTRAAAETASASRAPAAAKTAGTARKTTSATTTAAAKRATSGTSTTRASTGRSAAAKKAAPAAAKKSAPGAAGKKAAATTRTRAASARSRSTGGR